MGPFLSEAVTDKYSPVDSRSSVGDHIPLTRTCYTAKWKVFKTKARVFTSKLNGLVHYFERQVRLIKSIALIPLTRIRILEMDYVDFSVKGV